MLPWMILIGRAAVTNSGGEHHGPPPEYRGYRIVLVEPSSWSFSADPVTPELPILDTLAGDKAMPYIVNFQMVDTDKDGMISAAEFKTGCGKGWVQTADASTIKEMSPPAKL